MPSASTECRLSWVGGREWAPEAPRCRGARAHPVGGEPVTLGEAALAAAFETLQLRSHGKRIAAKQEVTLSEL